MTSETLADQLRTGLQEAEGVAAHLVDALGAHDDRAVRVPQDATDEARCREMASLARRALCALAYLLDPERLSADARAQAEAGIKAFADGVPRDENPYDTDGRTPDEDAAQRWDGGWLRGSHLEANPAPEGTERVTVLPGQSFRGTTHFEGADYCVTPEHADHLVAAGIVMRTDQVRRVLDDLGLRIHPVLRWRL